MQWLWQSDKCRAFCEENIVQFGVASESLNDPVQPAQSTSRRRPRGAASVTRIGIRLRTACELPVSSDRRIATEWPKITTEM